MKFKNRYRISSARAPWWDYGNTAPYFITICTKNREYYFGDIRNGVMHLSPTGAIADVLWYQIPHHFPDWELGRFVVMPNHIHGILIKKPAIIEMARAVETRHAVETSLYRNNHYHQHQANADFGIPVKTPYPPLLGHTNHRLLGTCGD